ncbi:unnamed protein product [Rotaria socialis]|uniref:Uncharacterized protein n=3 Tax=Rotaria socialis TaxID=392032 RepID=A0A821VG46_9BILA|nr:unnamed protein product [Rotaria socialis]CAF4905582.1 unnamed protein product [Rotaria socialis]
MVQQVWQSISDHVTVMPKMQKVLLNKQTKVTEYYASSQTLTIPKKIKEKVKIACTEFTALDCRAFEVVSGEGLSYCGLALRHVTQDFKLQNFILAQVDQSDSRHLSEPIRSDWNPIGFYRILSDLTELSLDSDTEDPTSIPRPGIQ